MNNRMLILVQAVLLIVIAGCGQTGPLMLPGEAPAPAEESATQTEEDEDEEEAR